MHFYFLTLLLLFINCATTEEVLKDTPPHGTHANVDIKIYEYSRSPGISIGKGYFYPEDKKNNDYFRIKTLISNKTSQGIEIAEYPVTFLRDDETKPIGAFFQDTCCTAKDIMIAPFSGRALQIDSEKMHRKIQPNEHFKKVYYYPYPKDAKPGKFLFKFKDVDGQLFEVMTIYDGEVQEQKAY